MSRRRGGQPGNVNAVKHGFYSRRFRDLEAADLEGALQDGLGKLLTFVRSATYPKQVLCKMMRVMIRRVFEYANEEAGDLGSSDKSPSECLAAWTGALTALGAASTRLAGLLRTQKLLGGNEGDVMEALRTALSEVTQELGIK